MLGAVATAFCRVFPAAHLEEKVSSRTQVPGYILQISRFFFVIGNNIENICRNHQVCGKPAPAELVSVQNPCKFICSGVLTYPEYLFGYVCGINTKTGATKEKGVAKPPGAVIEDFPGFFCFKKGGIKFYALGH